MKFFRLDGVLTLFCVLGILKLTGLIDLSWWWVTAPLWGPLAAVFVLVELAVLGLLPFLLVRSLLKFFLGMRSHK